MRDSAIAQRTGIIWVPEDPLDLLAISVEGGASDEEFWGMVRINQAGRDLLTGKIHLDTYLDMLEHYGIDQPQEIWNEAVQHVEFLIGDDLCLNV
jgi:hypothetical protein